MSCMSAVPFGLCVLAPALVTPNQCQTSPPHPLVPRPKFYLGLTHNGVVVNCFAPTLTHGRPEHYGPRARATLGEALGGLRRMRRRGNLLKPSQCCPSPNVAWRGAICVALGRLPKRK